MIFWKSIRVLALTALLSGWRLGGADFFPGETVFRSAFDASRVSLEGRVVDPSGAPLANCGVRLQSGEQVTTRLEGTFTLGGLARSNQLLTITAPGHYSHILPVQLFVPLKQTNIMLAPVVLWPEAPSVVRFLFGGDTSFARRMLDPDERAPRDQMPLENTNALIRVSDPLPGTLDVVGYVKPLFLAVDYPVVNFESVVTMDPSTPHLQKDFVYFTLPGSLPALKSLNIDYVGLGNNHTYDYLESGVSNTCYYLTEAGLHYSGLGSNSAAAFAPYRNNLKGNPYSFLAMTSIGGERFATNYVAGTNKGGAAYIESTAESRQAISAEKASGNVTIVQPHIGDEYTFEPSPFALSWMKLGVDAGADLVVSHHTHVAQGFGMYRGVLLVHCLGNLFFDQDRLETMVGIIATVDMEGKRVRNSWGTPVYLEDYRPRPMVGNLPSRFLRRIAEYSQQLRVFPYNGQAWLAMRPGEYSFADRRVVVPVSIGSNGWAVVDLRSLAKPEESLARLQADSPGLAVRMGRDLMLFGDFEDVDVDGVRGEASRWDFGTTTTVALEDPYRGTASLCLYRPSNYASDAVAAFRNRTRVMGDAYNKPNKDLSLFGYVRARQSGRISIVSRYYSSEGTAEFGEEIAFEDPGGTFDWRPFASDLHMPPDDPARPGDPPAVNARANRVFLHHSPPASGAGYAWFDELAVVDWEETLDPLVAPTLDTPHARDFLRLQGSPGTYQLALTFRSYRPIEVDAGHGPDLSLEPEQIDQSDDRFWFRPTAIGFDDVLRLILRNRGGQSLSVSNLAVVSGHSSDFLARWLDANGAVQTNLSIPPSGVALLEIRFVPSASGPLEAVLQFESNDPDQDRSMVTIVLSGKAFATAPVRYITANRTLSPTVHLQIPTTATQPNLLWEELPAGLTPANISHGGQWNPASGTLQWQNLSPRTTVSYQLTGTTNAWILAGVFTSGGKLEITTGDATAALFTATDSDSDGLPDWWERIYFDTRAAALPEVDSDGDGASNLLEFQRGTHPLDGGFQAQRWAPFLRNLVVNQQSATMEVVGFDGAAHRIEESEDLEHWRVSCTNVLSGQTVAISRKHLTEARSIFYRAVVEER